MRAFRLLGLLLFGLVPICVPATAQAARLALVVGINDYEMIPPLAKAVGDAEAMSARLQELGFEVTKVLNPDRRGLNQAISEFSRSLEPGDTALFHFSGHGVEVGGANLLLARDVPIPVPEADDLLIDEAIDLTRLMARISDSGASIRIFVIDACRDDPFERTGLRGIGASGGLGLVHPSRGSFIMYSAGYAQMALDRLGPEDSSPTSVYTRVLVNKLGQPGASISETARLVRNEVSSLARDAGHDQFPAYYDELTEDIVLTPLAPGQAPPLADTHAQGEAEIILTEFTVRQRLYAALREASDFERLGDDVQHFRRAHEARSLAAKHFGASSLEYADASNGLVGALTRMGRLNEAIDASRDAIRIYTVLFGERDLRVLNEKGNLASRLTVVGKTDEAKGMFQEMVSLYDELSPGGVGAVSHAHAYEGYALLSMKIGDRVSAEAYAARAYQLVKAPGIGERIDVGWIASTYARVLSQSGKCEAAKTMYRAAADDMVNAGVPPTQKDHAEILAMLAGDCLPLASRLKAPKALAYGGLTGAQRSSAANCLVHVLRAPRQQERPAGHCLRGGDPGGGRTFAHASSHRQPTCLLYHTIQPC